ncbi:hypothetical protein ACQP3L_34645, partial [Escherichia coli]
KGQRRVELSWRLTWATKQVPDNQGNIVKPCLRNNRKQKYRTRLQRCSFIVCPEVATPGSETLASKDGVRIGQKNCLQGMDTLSY